MRLWIQTDVSASTINSGLYAGFDNNQMLCAQWYGLERDQLVARRRPASVFRLRRHHQKRWRSDRQL